MSGRGGGAVFGGNDFGGHPCSLFGRAPRTAKVSVSLFRKNVPLFREYSSRIILIDGSTFADYMIDHGVGVSVASTYEIKKVDIDFFEEGI